MSLDKLWSKFNQILFPDINISEICISFIESVLFLAQDSLHILVHLYTAFFQQKNSDDLFFIYINIYVY